MAIVVLKPLDVKSEVKNFSSYCAACKGVVLQSWTSQISFERCPQMRAVWIYRWLATRYVLVLPASVDQAQQTHYLWKLITLY